ncbi:uncharacterized protein LOC114356475 [Ostrinia furnacalis]|uniref:uncharacterized protein LOC114356475 n=1 Tax=Ostrinia furnacalis TaxID=93504 RepID=UPI0010409E50|nr:uncharacterized protein LOC114356475 [Ostrinia furnacalis]
MSSKRKRVRKQEVVTRDLIRLIEVRPCLWDRTNPDYRVRTAKEAAWNEVYRLLQPNYDDCGEETKALMRSHITRKWYNVRDSYVKSRKQNSRYSPYIYSQYLTFLDTMIFDDNDNGEGSTEESQMENIEEHWLSDVMVLEDDASEPETKNVKESDKALETDDTIVAVLANLIQKEEDEDRAFFKSIVPMVKSLSEDSRLEFRIQVMNLLKILKSKDKEESRVKKEQKSSKRCDDDDE